MAPGSKFRDICLQVVRGSAAVCVSSRLKYVTSQVIQPVLSSNRKLLQRSSWARSCRVCVHADAPGA